MLNVIDADQYADIQRLVVSKFTDSELEIVNGRKTNRNVNPAKSLTFAMEMN